MHQAAASGDERAGIGEGKDARDVGGDKLADRMTRQEVGPDAPSLHQSEQGDFEGEQRGLGERGLMDARGVLGAFLRKQDVAERSLKLGIEVGANGIERLAEGGEGVVQGPPHAGTLAALAGKKDSERAHCAVRSTTHERVGRPCSTALRVSSRSARSWVRTTARWSKWVREVARE